MKVKIGTQIEDQIYRDLKVVSARERIPIGELIQNAVAAYLSKDKWQEGGPKSGLERFLETPPIKISDENFHEILEADYYEQ